MAHGVITNHGIPLARNQSKPAQFIALKEIPPSAQSPSPAPSESSSLSLPSQRAMRARLRIPPARGRALERELHVARYIRHPRWRKNIRVACRRDHRVRQKIIPRLRHRTSRTFNTRRSYSSEIRKPEDSSPHKKCPTTRSLPPNYGP